MKKNFKSGVKTVNIKKNKTVSATIKKLKKKNEKLKKRRAELAKQLKEIID